ncbi:DoxX family protein [Lederbergia wuyishanensis]|uniref:Membrane protein YphA (DoxX/SURF4 family) n=1 Tax=Lederbergia wuyishanensis TaxID=1347903 RepID=A0ABU0D7V4_9BACI|nr:DoxX family protein [Lederbergia wuyishanensis]MCJ8009139.1 DoxX family protein [Lederbergia wuyishanensis]MDQ0344479.1 putative membrane protein YphA (DoxX/SURF4 family) [Lederbergia wuyishanensis]
MIISYKLIRYVIAYVFIISGLLKLINEDLGSTFVNLGLPFPLYLMYAVALIEIICGVLILADKMVHQAVIPLIGIMIAAILLTKVPSLNIGFMQFAFNARLDIVMLVLLWVVYKWK